MLLSEPVVTSLCSHIPGRVSIDSGAAVRPSNCVRCTVPRARQSKQPVRVFSEQRKLHHNAVSDGQMSGLPDGICVNPAGFRAPGQWHCAIHLSVTVCGQSELSPQCNDLHKLVWLIELFPQMARD